MKKTLLLILLIAGIQAFGQVGFYENIATGFAYTTQRPQLVRAADFDGDGDLDIVAHGASLNWYENVDGQGNFGQKKAIDPTFLASVGGTLETADFDNDGDLDVIASSGNKLNVYRNINGYGNFVVMQAMVLGTSSAAISARPVDMNNDGLTDILAYYNNGGGQFQGWISWFENTGTGAFGPAQILNNNSSELIYGTMLYADDLDNDNDTDVVLGYGNSNKLAWFENTGNNVLAPPVTISTTASGISYISTADMDNDGDQDIVTAQRSHNQVAWFKNTDGQGAFSDEIVITSSAMNTYTAFVTDLNGDNTMDVVYAGTNEIGWHGNTDGAGAFSAAQVLTTRAYEVRSVITADLDGDGKNDLISASYDDDKVAWYKNLDNGNFGRQLVIGRAIESPNFVYTGDFDGDGDLDLLANSQHDAKLTWLENVNGIGFFGKEHIITESVTVGNQTPIAYPVDLDGDGDLDIASRQGSSLFWRENDGNGNFEVQHVVSAANQATIIRAADLDGDGDHDLLTGQYNNDKLVWYANNGDGTFGAEQTIYNPGGNNGSLTSLQIADMDGDGDQDFIVSSYNSYTNYYKNVDGQGTFVDQNNGNFDWLMAVYPVDIDGDGDLDVIGVDSNGGGAFEAVVWYENTGGGAFTIEHDVSTLTIHGQDIWAADLDNDGDNDVITAAGHEQTSGQLAWYPNNGDGTFAARQMIHERFDTSIAEAVTVADIDNDGKLDVVSIFGRWSSNTLGKVSVFHNMGELGNSISGTVTIDADLNGCTTADPTAANIMVMSNNGGHDYATFTSGNGSYQMPVGPGSYTTALTPNLPAYFTATPAVHTFSFSGMNNSYAANFCMTPTSEVNDVAVSVYPLTELRPGFASRYQIVLRNNGTMPSSGTIVFEYENTKLNFVSASEALSSQTASTLEFSYSNLTVFETRTIEIEFLAFAPPTVVNGNTLLSTVSINPVAQDATTGDNAFPLSQVFIGSYDPNDIRCLQGDEVPIADAGKYLNYIIRFQNTGTASAINIRVENTLDAKLDWTTMQLESLSHPGRVEIVDGNLRFIFDNINLAASTVDEPNSHGFITYKIKPVASIVEDDVVNSTADIYFDFNEPITTNTASTVFTGSLGVNPVTADGLRIFPNPVSNVLNFSHTQMIESVTVLNLMGQTILDQPVRETSHSMDLSGLSRGTYLVKVETASGVRTVKILKM